MKLEFSRHSDSEHHDCESHRDGDFIVFRCPSCPGYERKINWRTGETKVVGDREDINHSGSYFPYDIMNAYAYPN